jgi:sortase A
MNASSARLVARNFDVRTVEAQSADVRRIPVNGDMEGSAKAIVIGRLEIPRIGISVPILSDYEASSLLKGVGHVPGTAMPGGLGTLGLAGHRDTYFRPLRSIQTNMDIRVVNAEGVYHYSVDSTEVVTPENVSVLDIRDRPELTLITCYPFYYVGAAPKRFIVHAHLISALPDAK